ncbi:MAG: hypothetical protein ACRDK1_04160 [Solirubrobacterales bacterium]
MVLATYGSLAVVCVASLLIGQAVLLVCGRHEPTWLAGPVGLAAILTASGIAIKLPGHATAVAITLAVLSFVSLVILALRGRAPGAVPALIAAGLTVLVASVPFIANGRIGVLGVGLVNDDMANHLLIADWLKARVGEMPALIHQGYPVGPHALVAGLSQGLGAGLIEAFAGLTLAIPALTALVAFEALRGVRAVWRVVAAALSALPYLAAAYVAQEAFKEPIQALFVLSFALLLPAATNPRRAVPLGIIAAGSIYAYSFPGLFWLAGTAAIWLIIGWFGRRGASPDRGVAGGDLGNVRSRDARTVRSRDAKRSPGVYPRPLLLAGAGVAVLLVLAAPDLGRVVDFTNFRALKSATISGVLGNLRHQLSPLEALGIWPASDFRLSAADASGPTAGFYLGALVAAVALVLATPRWIRRNGWAVPSALAAAGAIYLGALAFGTVYTSAKALAIAAPLVTLISFGGLLNRRGGFRRVVAVALALGIAASSFLVLRQAPVAPSEHADQLAELRPLVAGRDVLFLGRDNFVSYELRGARAFTAVRNYYDPNYVKPNLHLRGVFRKFDFDSVTPRTLARFPFVITTSASYASGPPPGFRPLRRTSDFVLWGRTGPIGARRTLAEGPDPGAIRRCRGGAGAAGRATVFPAPPVTGAGWSPGATVEDGAPVTQTLTLPAGRWRISLPYDATRPVHVSAPGLDATLPANLDYRGSTPYYPAGELRVPRAGPVRFTVAVERPPLAGRLLGTKSQAHLGTIAASRAGTGGPIPGEAERQVALSGACGRYLDWYRPAPGR